MLIYALLSGLKMQGFLCILLAKPFPCIDLYFQLNAEIAKLQGMQHKYSLLEFESTKSMWLHQSGDEVPESHCA